MWHAWDKGAYRVFMGKSERKGHFEDFGVNGGILLK
jgi:hypothetical protein